MCVGISFISSQENIYVIYLRNIYENIHSMGVLYSFSIKKFFYDKMDLRLFYLHVTICSSDTMSLKKLWLKRHSFKNRDTQTSQIQALTKTTGKYDTSRKTMWILSMLKNGTPDFIKVNMVLCRIKNIRELSWIDTFFFVWNYKTDDWSLSTRFDLRSYSKISFIKRQMSGTWSENDWQPVVQPVTKNGNEWYNEWQLVLQRVTTNDSEWEQIEKEWL